MAQLGDFLCACTIFVLACHAAPLTNPIANLPTKRSMHRGIYVIGVDAGTESVRVGIFDLHGKVVSSAQEPYQTYFPQPGHAEQNPCDWWESLGVACSKAMQDGNIDPDDVKGLAVDSTSCSVVALDKDMSPIRPCLMWMDVRSADQCAEILAKGKVDAPSLMGLQRPLIPAARAGRPRAARQL
jgi:sugar (pentulose or hexulose) kinase